MSNLHSFVVILLALAAIFVPQLLALYLNARRDAATRAAQAAAESA